MCLSLPYRPAPAPSGPARFIKGHRRSTSHHNISREIQLSELAPTAVPVPAWPLYNQQPVSQQEFEREVGVIKSQSIKCSPAVKHT